MVVLLLLVVVVVVMMLLVLVMPLLPLLLLLLLLILVVVVVAVVVLLLAVVVVLVAVLMVVVVVTVMGCARACAYVRTFARITDTMLDAHEHTNEDQELRGPCPFHKDPVCPTATATAFPALVTMRHQVRVALLAPTTRARTQGGGRNRRNRRNRRAREPYDWPWIAQLPEPLNGHVAVHERHVQVHYDQLVRATFSDQRQRLQRKSKSKSKSR